MYNKRWKYNFNLILLLWGVALLVIPFEKSFGQISAGALDMFVLIDNSCSMFPKARIIAGCEVWGNDPDFLRIIGADLFMARLGFAEVDEESYQLGIISIGDEPELISDLTPIATSRDILAEAIANPAPRLATKVIPAFELAYERFEHSPTRITENDPAIVMITDGLPYPKDGQTNTDIEKLLQQYMDIPVFIILLSDDESVSISLEYTAYISFWKQMDAAYEHVFVYEVENADQIEDAYNRIIAQLQDTVPGEGIDVDPSKPLSVFVDEYVRKIILTIIHTPGKPKGTVTITDPMGNPVMDSEPGVRRFPGEENPVEVISIELPRLDATLRNQYWTVSSSDQVKVFLDRQGAYRINFIAPPVGLTDVSNNYVSLTRQSPEKPFILKFHLLDQEDQPVVISQPVWGDVLLPDGSVIPLPISRDIAPDELGIYEVAFDLRALFPEIANQSGRFTFTIRAGNAEDEEVDLGIDSERVPIAFASMLVDAGPGPYFDAVSTTLTCQSGVPVQLLGKVSGLDTIVSSSFQLDLNYADVHTEILPGEAGNFTVDVTELCAQAITTVVCSGPETITDLSLRMNALLKDGASFLTVEQTIEMVVQPLACTPTPEPTATLPPPPPPPTPTPIPDTDLDGFDDSIDQCPQNVGIAWFDGCPYPVWFFVLAAILGGMLVAVLVYGFLWIRIRTFAPPPQGFVGVCAEKSKLPVIFSVHAEGEEHMTNKISIGGDAKKDHIHVEGLQAKEFFVVQQGNQVVLLDGQSMTYKTAFSEYAEKVHTSNSKISLVIGLKADDIKCK